MKRHYLVPARFRPFHNGHKYVIDHLLAEGNVTVIVCSSNVFDGKNPILPFEVREMVKRSVRADVGNELFFGQMPLYENDAAYVDHLQSFLRTSHENFVVTGNTRVRGALQSYGPGNLQVRDTYEIVPASLAHITATDVRNKILVGDITYLNDIPTGSQYVIEYTRITSRLRLIQSQTKKVNTRISLAAHIKISPNHSLYVEMPNDETFLDDYVTELLRKELGLELTSVRAMFEKGQPLKAGGVIDVDGFLSYEFVLETSK